MSSFGTKKYGADLALQMTFPTVFAAAVASSGKNPYGYLQSALKFGQDLPEGKDLQAAWHEQKLADANRMAMAKVHATQSALEKWWHHTAPSNYVKPVLAQRKFANPSSGNQADVYAARKESRSRRGSESDSESLHGGVLRTAEGQKFGHKMMMNRVGQLNAIDAAKANFALSLPVPTGTTKNLTPNKTISTVDDLVDTMSKFLLFIQGEHDPSYFTPLTVKQLTDTLFYIRTAIISGIADYTKDDYDDVFYYVDEIDNALGGLSNDRFGETYGPTITDLNNLTYRIGMFGKAMVKHLDESPQQKKALVKEYAKKFKLGPLRPSEEDRKGSIPFAEANAPKPYPLPPPPAPPAPPAGAQGQGGSRPNKKWIQKAIQHPGALTKAAKRHGETAAEFAEDVLTHPEKFTKTTQKRAQLAKTLRGFHGGKDADGTREDAPSHGLNVAYGAQYNPRAFNGATHFDTDNRSKFGNQSGAYLGESLGQQVAVQQVPVPVEPDGTYIHPTTGYMRPVYPKMPIDKKPSNTMKARPQAPLPMFQDSASGIFSAPRLRMPPVELKGLGGAAKPECPTCHKCVKHRGACPKARRA